MDELHQKALSLPLLPGVYMFYDADGNVIYVGKAKLLKNRVTQYFHRSADMSPKTAKMVSAAARLEYIVTASEFEALMLECQLIKQYKPRYNILLKDDKGYPFIRLDRRKEYPVFEVVNRRSDDGAEYFGPYGGRSIAFSVIESVSEALKLPLCSKKFPRDIGKDRPCLHYRTGRCYGVCTGKQDKAHYRDLIDQAVTIINGGYKELSQKLQEDMEAAAEKLEFERAAILRDRISAISRLDTKQKIVSRDRGATDAVGYFIGESKMALSVLSIRGGIVASQRVQTFAYSLREECADIFSEFIIRYYSSASLLPDRILIPTAFEDMELLGRLLSEAAGRKVSFELPQRGLNRKLLDMAESNARAETERTTTESEKVGFALSELARIALLPSPPKKIESYDISNTGSDSIVASRIVYLDGRPDKSLYRRYSVKSISAPDDCAAMKEIISRRLKHTEDPLPDLILTDGAAPQASSAVEALSEAGLTTAVLGMVKDDRHTTRALVTPSGQEIGLSSTPAVFALVAGIQNEVHRFAITYHRAKRSKKAVSSALTSIPGIGKARALALMKKFGSLNAIKKADVSALSEVVPAPAAVAVYDYFNGDEHK